ESDVRRFRRTARLQNKQTGSEEDVAHAAAGGAHEGADVVPGLPHVVPLLLDAGVDVDGAQAVDDAADATQHRAVDGERNAREPCWGRDGSGNDDADYERQ